jgi:hypothetical protein
MLTFDEYSPTTPGKWSITERGGLFDAFGDQRGHYKRYHPSPGYPLYRDLGYVLAAVYDRQQPGTGTGGHTNYRSSTWASVADAKQWMLAQLVDHSPLI